VITIFASSLFENVMPFVHQIMLDHTSPEQRFDVVDLDPYGSASPFLDIGVQCVADGGLMCVTCTDMAVLCGAHSESCFSKYGSVAIKSKACHEEALRIVLHTVEASASRHKRAITPLLSVHMDFYVRVFVRVHISPKETKLSMSKTGMIYQVSDFCNFDQLAYSVTILSVCWLSVSPCATTGSCRNERSKRQISACSRTSCLLQLC
jgi:tRNA G26 N,N-dimethylase Trm1